MQTLTLIFLHFLKKINAGELFCKYYNKQYPKLQNEHCITITEKSVFINNSLLIGILNYIK
jgi:hypothetical protein